MDQAAEDRDEAPPQPPMSRVRMFKRVARIAALLLAVIIAWLALSAPLSRSLQPVGAPGLTILSADGEPIARRGAVIGEPVSVEALPEHVGLAFLAIEDRRFYSHIGIDPWGVLRAMIRNVRAGQVREGGSTISQQLAKTSFLSPDRTAGRKLQEAFIALWLEAWLSKEEILSRYLSNVYFGDNVYGLRAAARRYFDVDPEDLSVPQAAMLAAIVNAPSRLAPTSNLKGAQTRSRRVMNAMKEAGFITAKQHAALTPARLNKGKEDDIPTGTYFADWVIPQASELEEGSYGERQVVTTLDGDLQRLALSSVRRARLGGAQAALVAMRLDGRVVAMVGGKDYRQSAFNRATQAQRQPGSAFKLFVYLAAFRNGYTPITPVNDVPIRLADWEPANYEKRYRGRTNVREAVAFSSNSVAVQVQERVGRDNVIRAARDLGITSPLQPQASLALGVNGVSLLELTAAYAAVAAGRYPIRPHGLPRDQGWFGSSEAEGLSRDAAFPMLRDVLYAVVEKGTGRAASLSVPTFGKTGTTSDYRDAWFIGFAGDLVVGVWVGNDNNRPLPGTSGGGVPAQIWRSFMSAAIDTGPTGRPAPVPLSQADRRPEPAAANPSPEPSPAPQPTPSEPDGVTRPSEPAEPEPEGDPPLINVPPPVDPEDEPPPED